MSLYGDYRIVRVLGQGGMGVVYEAEHGTLGRRVALKVLLEGASDDPVALSRLRREALAMGALQHPHIVQVSDFAEGPPPFVVMELLKGQSLRERLIARGPMSAGDACLIAVQLLSALAAAHDAGIVHRDVKPANVFVVETPLTSVYVKLLDFGVAKLLTPGAGPALTHANAVVGSIPYMAPEQLRGEEVDAKTDIFAVGVTLYEMLAGRRPFVASPAEGVVIAILRGGPIVPLAPSVPRELEAVILRALQRTPSSRYLTAQEMAAALLPFVPRAEAPLAAITTWETERRVSPTLATAVDRTAVMTPGAGVSPSAAAPTPPATSDALPSFVGRFEIRSLLGQGGMAQVFRAFDPMLDRLVALKVLHARPSSNAEASARQRTRIVREARAAAALTHPNTVTIFEVGEAHGEPFIAMELLEGATLRQASQGEATVETRLRWLLEAARALTAAHARGLVHRDVKPDNMFIERDGRLKLLDFGIAKRGTDDLDRGLAADGAELGGPSSLRTVAGRQVGTPRYMAPEQRAGQESDARTDQYAWGLVAFELLTGSLPAFDEDVAKALRARTLPEPIVGAVARALAARKEDRAPSLQLAIDALESARSHGASTKAARGPSRRLVVAGVVIVTIVGAGAVGVARWRREVRSAVAAAPPSQCRVASSYTFPDLAPDGIAVQSGGIVVGTFDASRADAPASGVSISSATDAGATPFGKYGTGPSGPRVPMPGATIRSTTVLSQEMLVSSVLHREPNSAAFTVLSLWGPTTLLGTRLPLVANGVAVASVEEGAFVALTYGFAVDPLRPLSPEQLLQHAAGIVAFRPKVVKAGPPLQVERYLTTHREALDSPALAVSASRVAMVFREQRRRLVVVFVDHQLAPAGDPMTVAIGEAELGPPAATYLGDTLVVVWPDGASGKTRLRVARLVPGAAAFENSTLLVDESVPMSAPVIAPLASGGSLVGWLRSGADGTTLRAARLAPSLSLPFDLGRTSTASALAIFAHGDGASIGWVDTTARRVTVADVSCAPMKLP